MAQHTTRIHELPLDQQPRVRFYGVGARALSDAELLTVAAGLPTLDSAQALLADHDGVQGIARATVAELSQTVGMTEWRALQLLAGVELGRRASAGRLDRMQLRAPTDVAAFLMVDMGELEQEEFRVILLDTKNRVQKVHTVYVGNVNSSMIRIGEVYREPVRYNSVAIIVAHNHPSGDPTPSPEDVLVTRQIVDAGKLMDIELLDHIVIGSGRYVSLRERGLGF